MTSVYDTVLGITSGGIRDAAALHMALRDFSYELGWRPSYPLIEPCFVDGTVRAHLVVEHGLEPSAVITFLDGNHPLSDMRMTDQNRLLGISYNNLVDWHLYVEPQRVSFCYNRIRTNTLVDSEPISRTNYDKLRNEAFEKIVGRKPNPNLPNLDEALIETISTWKRVLAADLGAQVSNSELSALFNAILFTRAIEDQKRSYSRNAESRLILDELNGTLLETLRSTLRRLGIPSIPRHLIDEQKLAAFDSLPSETIRALVYDFYYNRHAPYNYDFSVMSKHALSRIYEHYSSLLSVEDSPQASFFPRVPEEEWNKTYGSIYTPQFIARFFARFIKNQFPPVTFRRIRTVDPACGSGIFLRTILELQCDPLQDGVRTEGVNTAFSNVLGVDVDDNACQATRLSLALLYMAITGDLPNELRVVNAESIKYFQENRRDLESSFDVVIVNPPFISTDTQTLEMRECVAQFMNGEATGRIDMYLPFLLQGLEMLKPGGYGLYVLPHSFLIAASARSIRERLARECWIHCLADLSAIRIFGKTGSYIVLLIFQKKSGMNQIEPSASIISCRDSVGYALEDYLNIREIETDNYSIYRVPQSELSRKQEWILLPPNESMIKRRLESMPKLGDLAFVREGAITAADDVFIIEKEAVPPGEDGIFVPLLTDREMARYNVPKDTMKRMFYPFIEGRRLSERELQQQFPETWRYLLSKRERLETRKSVKNGGTEWWAPVRPRSPQNLLRPKIVSPHLVIMPRFSFDISGKYAISHSPFIYPKEASAEDEMLRYLLAVLNSPIVYWYISAHSHKYSRGYAMLEAKTVMNIPIPDPSTIPAGRMMELLQLVNKRISVASASKIEAEIERIVFDLYGVSPSERKSLGLDLSGLT